MEPNQIRDWDFGADINQDSEKVAALNNFLQQGKAIRKELEFDIKKGTDELIAIVSAADGLQKSGERINAVRHFSNVMYNAMRGGIFGENYQVDSRDFALYVKQINKYL